jgi:putative FmdB family regulatory protein
MPTYEYACQSCGHDLEVFQRMSDDPLETCPSCNTPSLKRKIGLGAGIIFKGGGFYETDFKDKKGSASSTSSGSPKKETPAKKTDSKAD